MKAISLNISLPQVITFHNKKEKTGFFKKAVDHSINLGLEDVKDDCVIDRVNHGGKDKACYLYSHDHYDYWKQFYPALLWDYGMFGENITLSGMDESKIRIGDVYKIGSAIVQVSQPRQPCYKLGIKFGNQKIVKEFCAAPYPGIYVRVLQEGLVNKEDVFELNQTSLNSMTVLEVFQLIYMKNPSKEMLIKACSDSFLAESVRKYFLKKHADILQQ